MNLLKHALDLNNLRKVVGYEIFWQAVKSNLRLQILDTPQELLAPTTSKLKILVLAPHPDDDAFALGGTIYKFTRASDEVIVLYLCDGSKGTPEGIRDSSLITKRKKESEEAGKILDIKELIFWKYRDGQIKATNTSVKAMANLLEEITPDIVFLPSLLDNHPDHQVTNEIFYITLFQFPIMPLAIPKLVVMYEVWSPLFPNRLIKISDVIKTKQEVISCHQSQLKSRNYDQAILALNRYRAEINNIKGYAESFFVSSPEIYKKLSELMI